MHYKLPFRTLWPNWLHFFRSFETIRFRTIWPKKNRVKRTILQCLPMWQQARSTTLLNLKNNTQLAPRTIVWLPSPWRKKHFANHDSISRTLTNIRKFLSASKRRSITKDSSCPIYLRFDLDCWDLVSFRSRGDGRQSQWIGGGAGRLKGNSSFLKKSNHRKWKFSFFGSS